MKLTLLASLVSLLAFTTAQECGEAPEGALDGFGKAIGPFPQDIPTGCSAFEILVARGTSEPNYEVNGKFGIVVGDPVVSNTTLKIPGARGYPVQVCLSYISKLKLSDNEISIPPPQTSLVPSEAQMTSSPALRPSHGHVPVRSLHWSDTRKVLGLSTLREESSRPR